MKNKLKKFTITKIIAGNALIIGLAYLFISYKDISKPNVASKLTSIEDSVDLSLAAVEYTTAYRAIKRGVDSLSVNTNSLFPEVEIIKKAHLDSFKVLAVSQHTSNTNCSSYIPAVRIYFAIDPTQPNKLHLIYQPISCCYKSGTKPDVTYSISIPDKSYYEYSPTMGFIKVSNGLTSINQYQSSINIKRSVSSLSPNFQVASDSTGDVLYMTYTFQEMELVLSENKDSNLKLWSYLSDTYVQFKDTIYTKHGLFLSPGSFVYTLTEKQLKNAVPFKGNFANHPHLCPPACADLIFKIR